MGSLILDFPTCIEFPYENVYFLSKGSIGSFQTFQSNFCFFCKNDPFTQPETNKSITICDIVLDLGNVSVDIAQIMKSTIFLINK